MTLISRHEIFLAYPPFFRDHFLHGPIMSDFARESGEISRNWFLATPGFDDISFRAARWVNVIGCQTVERGLF